ncbi:MAG: hypothetical protein EPN67_02805 [Pusillimonas sp.]|uniref:HGGxSTG domain-containing protein n=1 Tax=Rhodanobacter sp. FW021-MT20 TaxID=1162282 RepID=UPI001203AFB2|nr:MAG: hypothetical protein EPN67_02805 [Pusillimonas sp.]
MRTVRAQAGEPGVFGEVRARADDTVPGGCPGSTRRGVPADYAGDDPRLCNARTKSGRPCRALKLGGGRCKWHGGLSTGPRTPEGKARCADNLRRWREGCTIAPENSGSSNQSAHIARVGRGRE